MPHVNEGRIGPKAAREVNYGQFSKIGVSRPSQPICIAEELRN